MSYISDPPYPVAFAMWTEPIEPPRPLTFAEWYADLPTIDDVHRGLDTMLDDENAAQWSTAPVGESGFFYVILAEHMGHGCPTCDGHLVGLRGVPTPVTNDPTDWALGVAELLLLDALDVWP